MEYQFQLPNSQFLGQVAYQALRRVHVGQRVPAAVGQLVGPMGIPVQAAHELRVVGIYLLGGLTAFQVPDPVKNEYKIKHLSFLWLLLNQTHLVVKS